MAIRALLDVRLNDELVGLRPAASAAYIELYDDEKLIAKISARTVGLAYQLAGSVVPRLEIQAARGGNRKQGLR